MRYRHILINSNARQPASTKLLLDQGKRWLDAAKLLLKGGRHQLTSAKFLLGQGKLLLQKAGIRVIQAIRSFVALVFCPDQGSRSADSLALA